MLHSLCMINIYFLIFIITEKLRIRSPQFQISYVSHCVLYRGDWGKMGHQISIGIFCYLNRCTKLDPIHPTKQGGCSCQVDELLCCSFS